MPNGQTPEINYLMSLVEKKFRRQVKTSTDFYSLASEVESQTGCSVSASTLKRIWGYVKMNPTPRRSTLDIMSKYIGKKDFKSFCEELKTSDAVHSMFFTADFISSRDLAPDTLVEIRWNPNRIVTLRHLKDILFEVVTSCNSQLASGDRFEVLDFIKGTPLYISGILRDGCHTSSYIAGRQGGLSNLRIIDKSKTESTD